MSNQSSAQPIEKKLEKQRAAKKQKQKTARTIAALCGTGLVVIGAVAFAVVKIYRSSGVHLQGTAMESTHYKVNNAMMSYLIDTTYQNYLDSVKGNKNAERPIKGKSFKKQHYGADQTWFDYLVQASSYSMTQTLKMCEAAYEADYSLTDAQIAECEAEAQSMDLSKYSDGIQVADVTEVLKLKRLANDYEIYAAENIEITEEELNEYYAKNSGAYANWDMLCFSIAWKDGSTNEKVAQSYKDVMKEVDKLTACTTPEAFKNEVYRFLIEERSKTTDTAKKMLDAIDVNVTGDSFDPEIAEWVLEGDAKQYDTKVLEYKDNCNVVVYMLTSEPTINQSDAVDVRVITLNKASSADESLTVSEAQTLLDDWKAAGGTETLFGEFALNNSSAFNLINTRGLYIGFSEESMEYGEEFRDWAFASDRKPGDTEIFELDSQVVIGYFVADNPYSADKAAAYQALYKKEIDALDTIADNFSVAQNINVINQLKY